MSNEAPHHIPSKRVISRVLWWSGLLGFAIPLTAAFGRIPRVPMVVSTYVIVDCDVLAILSGWIFGILCWAGWAVLRGHAPIQAVSGGRSTPRGLSRAWRWLRNGLAVVLIASGLVLGGVIMLFANGYHVLDPPSSGGCRIVVSVDSGMRSAFGDVYLMRSDSRVLTDTGNSWSQDDNPGEDPVRNGTWSLTWQGKNAILRLWNATDHPPMNFFSPHQVVCPR